MLLLPRSGCGSATEAMQRAPKPPTEKQRKRAKRENQNKCKQKTKKQQKKKVHSEDKDRTLLGRLSPIQKAKSSWGKWQSGRRVWTTRGWMGVESGMGRWLLFWEDNSQPKQKPSVEDPMKIQQTIARSHALNLHRRTSHTDTQVTRTDTGRETGRTG